MMYPSGKKENCTGCMACVYICPTEAISWKMDEEGFRYPFIKEEYCIQCGKCQEVCQGKHNLTAEQPTAVYAVKSKDEKQRQKSRSGGVFAHMSKHIIKRNGVVYGAALTSENTVEHIRVESIEELDSLYGSKYVQSSLENIYPIIKQDILSGRKVLFSGTPCQTEGVRLYMKVEGLDSKNLIICDMVCHGVPSPLLYKEYIQFWEGISGKKVKRIDFRDKSYGWHSIKETIYFENEEKESVVYWGQLFLSDLMLRPSCLQCQYAKTNRSSDITMGDFWGLEKVDSWTDDDKGTSLVLVQSLKGERLFENIKEELDWLKCELKDCLQPNLVQPSKPKLTREIFWQDYKENGFEFLLKRYTDYRHQCEKTENITK